MIHTKIFKTLTVLSLAFLLSLGLNFTTAKAITVYPIDYTFTGFGVPGTNVSIDIADSATPPVTATFDGVVKADGTYSVPAKFATKDGSIAIKVETDADSVEATIMFYDLSDLDTKPGFVVAPAILPGTGATPNATVKVELPDGSSFIEQADAAGNFKTPISNVQNPGDVTVTELDAQGLEIGTPKTISYDGGVQVVNATQTAAKLTPPAYAAPETVVDTTPTPNPILQNTTPVAAPAKVPAKVTVRTGGINDYLSIAAIIGALLSVLFIFRNRFSKAN